MDTEAETERPMADSAEPTTTDGLPGSGIAAHHQAVARPQTEAVGTTTTATAGHQGVVLAGPLAREVDQTRTRISPATAVKTVLAGGMIVLAMIDARPTEMIAGRTATETTALAEAGLRAWRDAIATVSATATVTCIDDEGGA